MSERLVYFFLVVLFLLIGWVFLKFLERGAIFYPMKDVELTPEDYGLNYKDIYFRTDDGITLNAWFVPVKKTRATLIYCHGNGGNISHRLEVVKMFNELNISVFIFDYRGYGRSKGTPSEKGTYKDAVAAYNYILSEKGVDSNKIVLYGESLGGAIAIDLATKVKIAAIISFGSLASTSAVAKKVFPLVPIGLVITQKFDALSKIESISCAKLIIHSVDDEIVSFNQGKELFSRAKEPKEFYQMRGGHNDAFLIHSEEFKKKIDGFLKKYLK